MDADHHRPVDLPGEVFRSPAFDVVHEPVTADVLVEQVAGRECSAVLLQATSGQAIRWAASPAPNRTRAFYWNGATLFFARTLDTDLVDRNHWTVVLRRSR